METDLIPWKTRDEWVKTYEDVYSNEYGRVLQGVQRLTEWKQIMKGSYRPGMDCTRGLLQVALKDKHFFGCNDGSLEVSMLQLMFSAEIMRFLNLVCNEKNNGKKISLYGKARSLGIPDWVVNIRHQMAHREDLASMDLLRMAVKFVLNWLKEQYWEVEKNEMREVFLESALDVVPENLTGLLHAYILLKEQAILGFHSIRDIQDPYVRELIFDVESFSLLEMKKRCKPGDLNQGEGNESKQGKNMTKWSLQKAVFNVVDMIKPYVWRDEVYGVNTLEIIIKKMIEDSVRYNGVRVEIWKILLKCLHSWHKFSLMIPLFYDMSNNLSGEESYQAGLWCIELSKALKKRFKVEALSQALIEEFSTRNTKNVKEINFDPTELKEFTRMLRKRKLDTIDSNDEKRLTCIFVRIEENIELKNVLRLKDPIFPERWEVLEMINKVASFPNEFSETLLFLLYDILKWPFPKKDLVNLAALTKIWQGNGIVVTKKKKTYVLEDLKSAFHSNISEEPEKRSNGMDIDDS